MAMSVSGNRSQLNGQMNVTPMVDILLVLLVIFMIVQTKKPEGMDAQIPQPAVKNDHAKPDDTPIVVQVRYTKDNPSALRIIMKTCAGKNCKVGCMKSTKLAPTRRCSSKVTKK